MGKHDSDKKINFIIPLCVVFSILYVIFAITKLTAELNFLSVWTVDSTREASENDTEKKVETSDSVQDSEISRFPFISGQNLGYFDENGNILFVKTFPFKATITSESYCIYGTNDQNMNIFDSRNNITGKIEKFGFPYFKNDKKFIFLPGGTSLSSLSDDGKELWTYEGYAPITAFSSSQAGAILGTSDGTIIVFDNEGSIRENFIPGGSEYPVILGCDISNDGKYIACLTGQNRQRFIIAHEKEGHWEIVFHKHLKTAVNYQTVVKFNNNCDTVYFDYDGGLGIINLRNMQESSIDFKGRVIDIEESELQNFCYILSKNSGKDTIYTVTILEPFDSIAAKFSYKAKNSFINVKNNMLFIGRDNEISRIDVERR